MNARMLLLVLATIPPAALASEHAKHGPAGAAAAVHQEAKPIEHAAHATPAKHSAPAQREETVTPPSRHAGIPAEMLRVSGQIEEHAEENSEEQAAPAVAAEPGDSPEKLAEGSKKTEGPVVAMDARQGRSVRAGDILTGSSEPALYVTRNNIRVELSPRSVAEFDAKGIFRLLRGSAAVESRSETNVRTAGARVEFVGKVLLSYDHQEKSSSVFVLDGEARLVNAHRSDSSMRISRFRGATLVVGELVPHLIRQLDVGAVQNWLAGYGWPIERRNALLKGVPGGPIVAKEDTPKHLEDTKIEDYFSSIDTADEFHQPDYYDKKFDDPDKVVAEQNSVNGAGKVLSPEEAALISLPKTQIELGFELGPEILSSEQKGKEVAKIEPTSASPAKRAPASSELKVVAKKKKVAVEKPGDPEVNQVLERLRQVRSGGAKASVSQGPASRSRAPSSVPAEVVPDPVYDYSQNF